MPRVRRPPPGRPRSNATTSRSPKLTIRRTTVGQAVLADHDGDRSADPESAETGTLALLTDASAHASAGARSGRPPSAWAEGRQTPAYAAQSARRCADRL